MNCKLLKLALDEHREPKKQYSLEQILQILLHFLVFTFGSETFFLDELFQTLITAHACNNSEIF